MPQEQKKLLKAFGKMREGKVEDERKKVTIPSPPAAVTMQYRIRKTICMKSTLFYINWPVVRYSAKRVVKCISIHGTPTREMRIPPLYNPKKSSNDMHPSATVVNAVQGETYMVGMKFLQYYISAVGEPREGSSLHLRNEALANSSAERNIKEAGLQCTTKWFTEWKPEFRIL